MHRASAAADPVMPMNMAEMTPAHAVGGRRDARGRARAGRRRSLALQRRGRGHRSLGPRARRPAFLGRPPHMAPPCPPSGCTADSETSRPPLGITRGWARCASSRSVRNG
jgi:hypothetical protein